MRNAKVILLIIFIISLSVPIAGIQPPANKELRDREAVVKSLLIGITSENYGLRTSSAYMLGELELPEGVIPLMRMLKSEESEEARIMAALSLFKIGDSRGIFAVKQAIRFDESERVSKMCEKLYHTYHQESGSGATLVAGF